MPATLSSMPAKVTAARIVRSPRSRAGQRRQYHGDSPGVIQLTNSQINASVEGSTTTVGGDVTIDPQFVILQNSQIIAQATQGQGGNISITTNALVPDATSLVDASSQTGISGTVRIQSPNAPAAGKIVPLSKSPLAATALLGERCAAVVGGQYSSFVVAGRYGLPTEPGGWLASPLAGWAPTRGVRRPPRSRRQPRSSRCAGCRRRAGDPDLFDGLDGRLWIMTGGSEFQWWCGRPT